MSFLAHAEVDMATDSTGGEHFSANVNLPSFQCSVYRENASQPYCSGTFLSKDRFVGAAHCFSMTDAILVANERYSLSIKCPGRDAVRVRAIAHHPNFFPESNSEHNFREGKLAPITSVLGMTLYNDVAILLTDEVDLDEFAALPTHDSEHYLPGSCRFLGYSPFAKNCSAQINNGCYRNGFSIVPPASNIQEGRCGVVNHINCNIRNKFDLPFLSPRPLTFGLDGTKVVKGDSGGGVLCRNQDGDEFLAAINSQDPTAEGREVINITRVRGFLQHFQSLSAQSFLRNYSPIPLHESFEQFVIEEHKAEINLGEISQYYKVDGVHPLLDIPMTRASHMELLKSFNEWYSTDPGLVRQLFGAKGIRAIRASGEGSSSEPRVYISHTNILVINEGATFEELQSVLSATSDQ